MINLRNIAELNSLSFFRRWLTSKDASRESQFLRRISSSSPYSVLTSRGALSQQNHSGVFFILGSGASVEDLSSTNFAEIRDGISVGINAWVLHDFVPNFYAYEPVENSSTDHFLTLSYLNRPDILDARPKLLILRPRTPFEWRQLEQVPASLDNQIRIYGRVSPFTRNLANLPLDLSSTLSLLAQDRFDSILIDSGASIVRMAHLGLKLGFKRIVFVGVDLNNVEYFWQRNSSHLVRNGIASFDSGQRGTVHETMSGRSRPFPILEMIAGLAQVAWRDFSCKFEVASRASALARDLSIYDWRR